VLFRSLLCHKAIWWGVTSQVSNSWPLCFANLIASIASFVLTCVRWRWLLVTSAKYISLKVIIEDLAEKEVNVYSKVKTTFKSGFSQSSAVVKPTTIKVSGPATAVNKVKSGSLVGDAIDIGANYEGNFSIVPVDESGNEVKDVKLSQSEGTLSLKIGNQKEVSIGSSYTGSLKDGLKVEKLELSSATVTIIGAPDVIDKIDKIETQPIDLSLITSTKDINLNFIVPEGIGITNNNKYVSATITIKQAVITTKTIDGIVVNLLNKKDGQFTYETSPISIILSGTADALSGLTAADFTASASVADLIVAGDAQVKLDVSLLKASVNVNISNKPVTIKVTVK